MSKVKCKVCANEVSGICSIKKVSVSINKSRMCEAYVYDESKVKAKQKIPSIRFGYKEQQEQKRIIKARMKELLEKAKNKKPVDSLPRTTTFDPKHPLTGDLSRFVTTATKKEG